MRSRSSQWRSPEIPKERVAWRRIVNAKPQGTVLRRPAQDAPRRGGRLKGMPGWAFAVTAGVPLVICALPIRKLYDTGRFRPAAPPGAAAAPVPVAHTTTNPCRAGQPEGTGVSVGIRMTVVPWYVMSRVKFRALHRVVGSLVPAHTTL